MSELETLRARLAEAERLLREARDTVSIGSQTQKALNARIDAFLIHDIPGETHDVVSNPLYASDTMHKAAPDTKCITKDAVTDLPTPTGSISAVMRDPALREQVVGEAFERGLAAQKALKRGQRETLADSAAVSHSSQNPAALSITDDSASGVKP